MEKIKLKKMNSKQRLRIFTVYIVAFGLHSVISIFSQIELLVYYNCRLAQDMYMKNFVKYLVRRARNPERNIMLSENQLLF
jgi:hypothetical protein